MDSTFSKEKVLEELKAREPIFHHPNKFGNSKQDILNTTCEEFCEVGASGNVYTRKDVVEVLLQRYGDQNYQDIWETKDFELTQIATNNYLITYTLIQEERVTRRSTIWRLEHSHWKIFYHQGTVVLQKESNKYKK